MDSHTPGGSTASPELPAPAGSPWLWVGMGLGRSGVPGALGVLGTPVSLEHWEPKPVLGSGHFVVGSDPSHQDLSTACPPCTVPGSVWGLPVSLCPAVPSQLSHPNCPIPTGPSLQGRAPSHPATLWCHLCCPSAIHPVPVPSILSHHPTHHHCGHIRGWGLWGAQRGSLILKAGHCGSL